MILKLMHHYLQLIIHLQSNQDASSYKEIKNMEIICPINNVNSCNCNIYEKYLEGKTFRYNIVSTNYPNIRKILPSSSSSDGNIAGSFGQKTNEETNNEETNNIITNIIIISIILVLAILFCNVILTK